MRTGLMKVDTITPPVIASVFGTLGFAEEEFWSSCLKLFVVIVFIFVGMRVHIQLLLASTHPCLSVCICGGGPSSGEYSSYVGGHNWRDPGAFANGFKGVCAVFVTAAFSFCASIHAVVWPNDLICPQLERSLLAWLLPKRQTLVRPCQVLSREHFGGL